MMPEPITMATSTAVPTNSVTARPKEDILTSFPGLIIQETESETLAPEAATAPAPTALESAIAEACERIAPLWPLKHFVAVNPFLGFTGQSFAATTATLRRVAKLEVGQGVVAAYVHNALVPNRGKIGVLVALESTGDADKLGALGRQLAMHIAAARPEALDVSGLDADVVARERAIHADKAKASGKPAEIIEKMVDGAMRKYYEQVVLLDQTFIIDGENKISAVIEKAAKDVGAPVKLVSYVRYELGEGVEKKADDFASEVAKMAAG
jgi:hypothetical protein